MTERNSVLVGYLMEKKKKFVTEKFTDLSGHNITIPWQTNEMKFIKVDYNKLKTEIHPY